MEKNYYGKHVGLLVLSARMRSLAFSTNWYFNLRGMCYDVLWCVHKGINDSYVCCVQTVHLNYDPPWTCNKYRYISVYRYRSCSTGMSMMTPGRLHPPKFTLERNKLLKEIETNEAGCRRQPGTNLTVSKVVRLPQTWKIFWHLNFLMAIASNLIAMAS